MWHQTQAIAGTQLRITMLQSFLSIFSVSATELPQGSFLDDFFSREKMREVKRGQGERGELTITIALKANGHHYPLAMTNMRNSTVFHGFVEFPEGDFMNELPKKLAW